MMLKARYIIVLTVLLAFFAAKNVQATGTCLKPAIIKLDAQDQERLDMAQNFAVYLEEQGQDPRIISSLYSASLESGVDFKLLILKAMLESNLGSLNEAKHSSARGIFQYIEPTWLTLIKRYGKDIGYQHYADAISISRTSGAPSIKGNNEYLRSEILALRYDPHIAALIKAHQVNEEISQIRRYKRHWTVTATDHFIVHLLGLKLAKEYYAMKNSGSILTVASHRNASMREAARLNRPFFYNGKLALSAAESYKKFEARIKRQFREIDAVANSKRIKPCPQSQKLASKD
jgi:hypothetical protein